MKKLFKNSFFLILCQLGGTLIPLVELPVLTHYLSPTEYGKIIYVMSACIIGSAIVEYGFTFSASRKISENILSSDKKAISQLCIDVSYAKTILLTITLIILLTFITLSGNLKITYSWYPWIVLITFAMGFSPIWYFLGTERLIIPALLDITIRSIGLIALIMFLPQYRSSLTVIIIISITGLINTIIPSLIMYNETKHTQLVISFRRAYQEIKEGFHLFIFKSANTLQQTSSAILLGFLGGANMVGIYSPAEKLNRAVLGLMSPIINVFFPHFIKIRTQKQINHKWSFIIFALSVTLVLTIIAIGIIFNAQRLVNMIFGLEYEQSIFILQILAVIIPLKGLNTVLNILWFVPLKKESLVNKIITINLLLLLPLAYLTIPIYGIIGFAIGTIIIEILTLIVLLIFISKTWDIY